MQQGPSVAAPIPLWKRIVFGRNPRRTLLRAAGLAVVSLFVFKFILLPVRISGVSMEPAYRRDGINAINRLAYVFAQPRRGDVVAVRYSRPPGSPARTSCC